MQKFLYFVIYSPGFSGSLFLSKVINSHKDVICLHETEMFEALKIHNDGKIETKFFFELNEKNKFSRHLFFMTPFLHHYFNAYKAVGTVETGRVNIEFSLNILEHYRRFQEESGKNVELKIGFLIRSPIKVINSLFREFSKIFYLIQSRDEKISALERYFSAIAEYTVSKNYIKKDKLEGILEMSRKSGEILFLGSTIIVFSFSKEISNLMKENPKYTLFKLEEITKDKTIFEKKLKEITEQEYNLSESILKEKVNQKHNSEDETGVIKSWNRYQREIFLSVFENCEEELNLLGYGYILEYFSPQQIRARKVHYYFLT